MSGYSDANGYHYSGGSAGSERGGEQEQDRDEYDDQLDEELIDAGDDEPAWNDDGDDDEDYD